MAKKKGHKPPQGRAKQKLKASRAGGQRYTDDYSDDEDISNVTFRGFGGQTSRVFASQDSSTKLRHKGIAFVSDGLNTHAIQEKEKVSTNVAVELDAGLIAAIQLNDHDEDAGIVEAEAAGFPQFDGADSTSSVVQDTPAEDETMEVEEDMQFVVDTIGDADLMSTSIKVTSVEQILRRSSPAPSDSSEEVVLFKGRKKAITIEDPIQESKQVDFPDVLGVPDPISTAFVPAETSFWRSSKAKNIDELAQPPQPGGAEDALDILRSAWKQAKQDKNAKKKAPDSGTARRGKRGRKHDNKTLQHLAAETDSEDAAYQDYLANVASSADRDDLVDPGSEIADLAHESAAPDVDMDEWDDTSDSAGVGEDLSDVLDSDDDLNASDLESSELEDELNHAEEEIMAAEQALYLRRLQGKSDEHLARLWAKQIELGIDADELVIDDGDELQYEEFGDVTAARAGFEEYVGLNGKRHRSKRSGAAREMTFPDATAFADAIDQYGNEGFDIMDYDRPSLRQTNKKRKGKLPPELEALSDEELRNNMIASWDRDRDKKRLKKAEREELRQQGLLGSLAKKGKVDLGQRYQQGMNIGQIRVELKIFLQDAGKTTQPFPPMDSANRKALHAIAHQLGLKSKSVGKGNTRYPVLYKTQKTVSYSESVLEQSLRSSSRGFFSNQSYKGAKGSKSVKRVGGAGPMGLKHGEVVGAGARELGKENFGHKLMEKMGWTKGMALGKDGEGVLEPVEQKMRVGRAGLG